MLFFSSQHYSFRFNFRKCIHGHDFHNPCCWLTDNYKHHTKADQPLPSKRIQFGNSSWSTFGHCKILVLICSWLWSFFLIFTFVRNYSKQVEQPAFAVTGVNNEEDFTWVLIQLGIIAFWYFLIMPVSTNLFVFVSLFFGWTPLWFFILNFICLYFWVNRSQSSWTGLG